ncbi:SusC/RagA family TonB-linked outer membrane protein [Muricauda ruestringensis]|uniref:SusC/RagA family TonB-linked outer membrane protein n=1 Tax=Flagellimonas aurea TaxID=2915619 RepID=A0ABS3G3X2_9FLAO|nr:SusC/RagA family TonB-linked outer membrane protein [Allomuricauda aurea]MBO0353546.1 SusC/RagA family TonB-linked outer membrane protein [Allomuricauda aurea]
MKIFTKPWDGPFPVPKPDLKMKLTVFLLIISLFQLQAGTGYAQKTKITLNMQGVTVLEVIEEIETITDFDFLYSEKDLDLTRKVSINARKKGIEDVLAILFKNSGVVYTINEKLIILKPKGEVSKAPTPGVNPRDDQQQFEVNGTITDPEGNPLPGVNIIIKGTNQGTMSGPDGTYSIRVQTNDILTFSYVGFKRVELPVNGPDTINIQMQEDVMSLEGVELNAGYYTVKEREMTGNISRITAEDIQKQPVANPLQALIGRMPGVQVTQQSGVPGGGFTVRIRGQNSLRTDLGVNEPLYIVDGVPYLSTPLNPQGVGTSTLPNSMSPFNSIEPSNIASIEVLKDADATAIYGSRGANGVVLITTKKGMPGKSQVNINVYSGAGKVASSIKLLNTSQYLEMRREAFANDNAEAYLDNPAYDILWPDIKLWDSDRYTNWQNELIGGTAYYNNMQASLSGGNANTQYLVGGSYFRQTTVYPGDNANNRISGHFNFSHTTPNQKFKTVLTASYTSDDINILSQDLTRQALTLAPNAPALYDDNGELNWENSTWDNPLAFLKQEYEGTTDNFITNATLDYELIKDLHISSQFGYNNMQVREVRIRPITALRPNQQNRGGLSQFSDSHRKTWIVEPKVTYKRNIGQGELNLLMGATFQQNTSEVQRISASGYTSDALLKNIQAAPNITIDQSDYSKYRYNAIFGRINYNWRERYIINLTGRRDGSSRFGPGKRFSNFGAVGVAWIFSKERFLQDSFISFGKLRGSYGTTGSDAIGDYGYLDTYSSTRYPYFGQPGLIPTRLANPDYQWETNKKLEAGLELGLVQGRVFISGSWYRNRSSNQLVGFPLPVITGQSTIQFNLPATVENKGWEFTLNTINIQRDKFSWRTGFNISFPENKLLEYENLEASPYANRYRAGKSLFIASGFHYLEVDSETGYYTFEDVDGNGKGTDRFADYQYRKEIAQQYYGGLQNTLRYKRFELDFFIQFVKQTGRNYFGDGTFISPGTLSNQPVKVMDRWQQLGDITDIQGFSTDLSDLGEAYTFYQQSDGSIVDASYIRLSNISLSWNLPERLGLGDNSRLYLQGQNLFTITNYQGLDPESLVSRSLPPLRVLTLGFQLSF